MFKNLAVFASLAVAASAKDVSLDYKESGFGGTYSEYLDSLNTELDRSVNYDQEGVSNAGKCVIRSGKASGAKRTTFVFSCDFEDVTEANIDTIYSLYQDNNFSKLLDPTYVPNAFKCYANNGQTDNVFGELTGTNICKTRFEFIEGLSLFDRELVFVSANKQIGECTVFGNPSVSEGGPFGLFNNWVWKNLGFGIWRQVEADTNLLRAQNVFPSGDRVCATSGTAEGLYNVKVEHMITTKINGLVDPLYSLGLFDQAQVDAYTFESDKLEQLLGVN